MSEVHVCTKDAIRIDICANGRSHSMWYVYDAPAYTDILLDMGIHEDNVGMDTLDKLKKTFPEEKKGLDHLSDFNYSSLSVRVLCESI